MRIYACFLLHTSAVRSSVLQGFQKQASTYLSRFYSKVRDQRQISQYIRGIRGKISSSMKRNVGCLMVQEFIIITGHTCGSPFLRQPLLLSFLRNYKLHLSVNRRFVWLLASADWLQWSFCLSVCLFVCLGCCLTDQFTSLKIILN